MKITLTINQEDVSSKELKSFDEQYALADDIAKSVKQAYWKFLKSGDLTLTIVVSKPPPDLGIHVSDVMDITDKFGG